MRPHLIRAAFGMSRVSIPICTLNPTIVTQVNDQCVFVKLLSFQLLKKLPRSLIKPLAHCIILGDKIP